MEDRMYVALSGPKGHESVTIREDYTTADGKKKIRILETLGPLSKLGGDDPEGYLAALKAEMKEKTRLLKEEKMLSVTLSTKEVAKADDGYRKLVMGHAVILRLWTMMKLDRFFTGAFEDRKNADRLLDGLFYLLIRRMSSPSSIRASHMAAANYAGVTEVPIDVLYSILERLDGCRDELIAHLDRFFRQSTDRLLDHVCYDVTNYYFESTKEGTLLTFGYSKEHRNNEVIIVMGLLIDSNGIPISFQLFSGDTMDQNTLSDVVVDLKKRYGIGEITVVADRGMNSNGNLTMLSDQGHHFVISYTLKKSKAEFRELCIGDEHPWEVEKYDDDTGELTYASKVLDTVCEAKVPLTEEERDALRKQRKDEKKRGPCPKYRIVQVPAKVHVTYSLKRRRKDEKDRERALEKLQKRIDAGQVKASMRFGCNQYLEFDVDCSNATIDQAKVIEAAKYDGYYAVITDRPELTTEEVMKIYREQWKIEESFRILKTDLEARPVFVWTESRIRGHFTLCYLALSVIRYLQHYMFSKGEEVMSAARIMDAVNESEVIIIGEGDRPVLGAGVTDDYIRIATLLGMPLLQKNMSPVRFKALTGLDPRPDIMKLVGKK